jgi:hypothetical protein
MNGLRESACIYTLEKHFFQNIEKHFCEKQVGHQMYNICQNVGILQHPCTNFPRDYLIRLFVRLRIFYIVKCTNKDLKFTASKNRKLCIVMNL